MLPQLRWQADTLRSLEPTLHLRRNISSIKLKEPAKRTLDTLAENTKLIIKRIKKKQKHVFQVNSHLSKRTKDNSLILTDTHCAYFYSNQINHHEKRNSLESISAPSRLRFQLQNRRVRNNTLGASWNFYLFTLVRWPLIKTILYYNGLEKDNRCVIF